MKIPLAAAEHRLLSDLFDPRRADVTFPTETAQAARLHRLLSAHGEPDLARPEWEAVAHLLGAYLHRLAGAGVPVAPQAPLDATVGLADHAPTLQHIHAQLVRHLKATE